jgi:hypothetical protein
MPDFARVLSPDVQKKKGKIQKFGGIMEIAVEYVDWSNQIITVAK